MKFKTYLDESTTTPNVEKRNRVIGQHTLLKTFTQKKMKVELVKTQDHKYSIIIYKIDLMKSEIEDTIIFNDKLEALNKYNELHESCKRS